MTTPTTGQGFWSKGASKVWQSAGVVGTVARALWNMGASQVAHIITPTPPPPPPPPPPIPDREYSSAANLKTSIEHHLWQRLVVTEGLSVRFEGAPWEAPAGGDYVETRIARIAWDRSWKDSADCTVDVAIGTVPSAQTGSVATNVEEVLGDVIRSYYQAGVTVPVYAYSMTPPLRELGWLSLDDVEAGRDRFTLRFRWSPEW